MLYVGVTRARDYLTTLERASSKVNIYHGLAVLVFRQDQRMKMPKTYGDMTIWYRIIRLWNQSIVLVLLQRLFMSVRFTKIMKMCHTNLNICHQAHFLLLISLLKI